MGWSPTPVSEGAGDTHGTTVLMLRFDEGVLAIADRRATMGNLVVYDRAEKIIPLDDATVVAISGSFARSLEVCRLLQHAFRYYRRMHLQDISLDGKLNEISKALAANMPMAMQGIGVFLPILAAYDRRSDSFGIYFFDAAGARFRSSAYASAGSGSERIRGVFEYVTRTAGPWEQRSLEEVLLEGLHMLDIAADLDSATGGFSKHPPAVTVLTREGTRALEPDVIRRASEQVLSERAPE